VAYEKVFAELALGWQLIEGDAAKPAGVEVVLDARQPYKEPTFKEIGGVLPDQLKGRMPLRISDGYCASYLWSEDRATLLGYIYNTGSHDKLESNHDLANRFHRLPQATDLVLGLRNLPASRLRYQVFDLTGRALFREGYVDQGLNIDLGRSERDYFVLVVPQLG
jgi:hypothetical protein